MNDREKDRADIVAVEALNAELVEVLKACLRHFEMFHPTEIFALPARIEQVIARSECAR